MFGALSSRHYPALAAFSPLGSCAELNCAPMGRNSAACQELQLNQNPAQRFSPQLSELPPKGQREVLRWDGDGGRGPGCGGLHRGRRVRGWQKNAQDRGTGIQRKNKGVQGQTRESEEEGHQSSRAWKENMEAHLAEALGPEGQGCCGAGLLAEGAAGCQA